MSGAGYNKRQQADARRAAQMKRDGLTVREIAEALKIKKSQVPVRVQLGERLLPPQTEGSP